MSILDTVRTIEDREHKKFEDLNGEVAVRTTASGTFSFLVSSNILCRFDILVNPGTVAKLFCKYSNLSGNFSANHLPASVGSLCQK